MATRSAIIVEKSDGRVKGVYSHYDGYPDWMGRKLLEYFNSFEKADTLVTKEIRLINDIGEVEYFSDGWGGVYDTGNWIQCADEIAHNGHIYVFRDNEWYYAQSTYQDLTLLTDLGLAGVSTMCQLSLNS